MRGGCPKQYLPLLGQPMLRHTLARLSSHPDVQGVVVALNEADAHWPALAAELAGDRKRAPVAVVSGGIARADSVVNAVDMLAGLPVPGTSHRGPTGDPALALPADPMDWVMVHDAARPCLRAADITALLRAVLDGDAIGGVLATPVRDTMKRADDDGRIEATVPRKQLWHALTPQVFRLKSLRNALKAAVADGVEVTDEASAMERCGARPRLVSGHPDNIKVTHPQDLPLAELFLKAQADE